MSQAGMEGGNALGLLLTGEITPSGKLTDSWAFRYEDYPNAASFSYHSGNTSIEEHTEGIYVGYRYFDSFDVPVRYAFGYGQSYTDFQIEPIETRDGLKFALVQEDYQVIYVSTVSEAMEQGADDYISKPFRIRELMARMKAIIRRTSGTGDVSEKIIQIGNNQVNLQTGRVYSNHEEIILTAMEYRLLLIFLNHRGQILTRGQILESIWDEAGDFVNDNTLSVYVKRL